MSSTAANEPSTRLETSPQIAVATPTTTTAEEKDVSLDEAHELTAERVRTLVRLMQCPVCSFPFREPVTLPCGRTLCKSCLPRTHIRARISYPATADRLRGFLCPFSECDTEHALGDCGLDVTLSNVVSAVKAVYDKGREMALDARLVTHVSIKDKWEVAGVPSLKDSDNKPRPLPGGRLLATHLLADSGELDYNAEVAYATPATEDHTDSDTVLFSKAKEVTLAELDCNVCYTVFCDPVTTPCGHTFCRACLQRVLDDACYCPVCRRKLTIQPMHNPAGSPANDLLKQITTVFGADSVDLGCDAIPSEAIMGDDREFDTRIFVCTLSFPTMPTFLHVFEPRYRRMVRDALEGDRTFGMVMYTGGGFAKLGTRLRIVHVELFPDGRSLLETVGISRFRIRHSGISNGYVVAKTESINDISIAEEERIEALETAPVMSADGPSPMTIFPARTEDIDTRLTQTLMDFATDFVARMKDQSVGWLTTRILEIHGECPDDPALFPWWFASILPLRETQKYRLLVTTSVRERLKICCEWILEWETSRRWVNG